MELLRHRYNQLRDRIEQEITNVQMDDVLPTEALQWWQGVVARHAPATPNAAVFPHELLADFWLEQGMLRQAWEAVARRFQNLSGRVPSPLDRLDISPLMPISDLIWGFIDDQHRQTTVRRRALEYLHQFGLRMEGRAVGNLRAADEQPRFLGAFHNLLNCCARFYREVDDTTVAEDGIPVLNALKELNLILSRGAHNQFRVLSLQVRAEIRMIQELFSYNEFREFLGGPVMTNYPELWMDRVDTLRRTMRWGDTSIVEFWHLARTGEWILLTVRYGPFGPGEMDASLACGWGRALRNQVMQFIHSYRAVTGVDLSAEAMAGQVVDATQPSVYLLAREQRVKVAAAL